MNAFVNRQHVNQHGTLLFNVLISMLSGLFIVFVALVVMAVFSTISVSEITNHLQNQAIYSAIWISLRTSLAVVILAVVFGLPLAYLLAMKNFIGKNIIDSLLDLPIVLPPLVSGLAILILLNQNSPIGGLLKSLNIDIIFTQKGIILAQFFVAAPFFIKAAKESMASIPRNLLSAASTLRASKLYTFFHVIIPLSKNGIIAGMVMCWARALGEFGATAMVAGCIPGKTETMTISIYSQSMAGDLNSAIVLSLFLTLFSFSSLVVLKYLFREKNEYYTF